MPNLPPRKYNLRQYVNVRIDKCLTNARIAGYEDGRNLFFSAMSAMKNTGPYPGWVYLITLLDDNGELIGEAMVGEEEIEEQESCCKEIYG